MNTQSNYSSQAKTELFNSTGAFFAFSNEQFMKSRKENIIYARLGHGLICPKDNIDTLINGLEAIGKNGRKKDLDDNSKESIIKRELYNHECFYSHDIDDACDVLEAYGITREEVKVVFYKELPNSDN